MNDNRPGKITGHDAADTAIVLRRVHELEAEITTKQELREDTSELKAARNREIEVLDKLACDELHSRGQFCPRWRPAPWRD